MNKLIFVILVCLAASAHAGTGSLHHIVEQVEQHVSAALEAFKGQLVQLIQQFKPELSSVLSVLNDFIGKLPQLQSSFVEKIKETLVNLVQMVLNGNARGVEGVKEVAEQRFFEQLQGLTTQLQTLAVSVVNHLLELLSGKPEMRFIDLSSILNNLNIQGIVENLQGQLGNIVNNLLGQLLNGKRGFTDFIMNELGLASVWNQIQEMGTSVINQFFAIGTQLLFAGQQIWAQAKVVLTQLLNDLTNHVGDASTIVAQAIASLNQILHNKPTTRGFTDFLMETLGLGGVVSELQNIGSNLLGKLMATLTQLVFAGQQVLANAKPILSQLVSDLTNHFGDASTIVAQAIQSLTQVIGQRGITDMIGNLLGGLNLGSIWTEIQGAGATLVGQLVAELSQLLVSGQQVINNAKPILQQMISDLTNHFGDASTIVSQAVSQLAGVLLNGGNNVNNRGLADFVLNSLGLGNVWSQIVDLGGNLWSQLLSIGTNLLFAGQQAINNAKPIIAQMINDLTNHFGDASTIVAQAIASLTQVVGNNQRGVLETLGSLLGGFDFSSIVSELQNIGTNLFGQLMSQLTQLIFAGQQVLANAKPILSQMLTDLTNHFGDASTIVTQAVQSLAGILKPTNRGLVDMLGNLVGGLNLGSIWTEIQSAGASLVGQLVAELSQILVSGQQIINNAKPILQQMVSDLTNHFGDASTIVQQAVNQLTTVLLNGGNQRSWITDMVSNLGLNTIWDQLTAIGSDMFGKLMAELAKLLFAGQAVWAQAQELFAQLVSDLTNHVGDASTIIAQAINQLGNIVNQQ